MSRPLASRRCSSSRAARCSGRTPASICTALGLQLISEAQSGAQALELLDPLVLPPEVLIVDFEMPAMDGVEPIQQLHRRGIRLPLIVASGREFRSSSRSS